MCLSLHEIHRIMSLNDWIQEQAQRGVICFSVEQVATVFSNHSAQSLGISINRLVKAKKIQFVHRGFYVIIPIQYQLKGLVPPAYYIHELMAYLEKPYYVGLLSAAAIYGASHQRAMKTQVVTIGPRPRTSSKNALIDWNYRQTMPSDLLERRNGEMGEIVYSSVELTAVDIIQFASNIGGYQRAATVLAELVDVINMDKMKEVLQYTKISTMQRLGYLLEFILSEQEKANALYLLLRDNGYFGAVCMNPSQPASSDAKSNRWRVNMNINVEIDEL